MAYWNDTWRPINSANTSTYYASDGSIRVRSNHFIPLPAAKHTLINARIENEQKTRLQAACGVMDSLKDVKARSAALVPLILNNYKTDKPDEAAAVYSQGGVPAVIINKKSKSILPEPVPKPARRRLRCCGFYISDKNLSIHDQKCSILDRESAILPLP